MERYSWMLGMQKKESNIYYNFVFQLKNKTSTVYFMTWGLLLHKLHFWFSTGLSLLSWSIGNLIPLVYLLLADCTSPCFCWFSSTFLHFYFPGCQSSFLYKQLSIIWSFAKTQKSGSAPSGISESSIWKSLCRPGPSSKWPSCKLRQHCPSHIPSSKILILDNFNIIPSFP